MAKLFVINTTTSLLPGDTKILFWKAILQSWTHSERSIPDIGTKFQEHNYYGKLNGREFIMNVPRPSEIE